ncbi:LysR substrate-binding domain-containing protein [Biostraticola tofi]|uniref:DNA-binding transcriptional LysR family regulator n=1 Tax=Biostraticola tofi TaxID=466109 RepID=A0A4R3YPP5_9GAMM|nr:LysR substrate-binding domain-containing protein [Biostraticola tofi]TCV94306.1 DNA-binding transcriptional LysR family regulator [Biostraticola tofi]
MQIEPLPPLNTLVAFECVARYCNFSRAAQELNLTQSAISRQIIQLEEMLGCKLFLRAQRRVLMTPRGEVYALQVRKLLAGISKSTAEVMGWSGMPQVTIACTAAIGSLWLSSRLSSLRLAMPELQLRLKTSDSFADLKSSEFDLAIFYLHEPPAGFQSVALFDEICYPMCSPSCLGRIGRLTCPLDLLNHTLLVQDDPQREWTGWADWFISQGINRFLPAQSWRANSYSFLVQAGIQGDGILLGWEGLVQDKLNRGELMAAHPFKLAAKGKCFLLTPQDRYTRPVIHQVIHWLQSSIQS